MREIVVPGEQDEIADRLDGVAVRQAQGMLRRADRDIRAFEHGDIERFLVAEVVIQHALVHVRPLGDVVDARAAVALLGEFLDRRLQDGRARALGIAHGLPARGFLG